MHYYRFNIGDYKSHTSHLDPLEDIAYRRMLDYCYLNEIGLPENIEEIGRLISMRTHCECIANVLREFFYIENGVYKNKRVEIDLHDFKSKSEKAANSAKEKWRKHRLSSDANAERTQCENDANAMLTNNHKPITNNHKPITNNHKPITSNINRHHQIISTDDDDLSSLCDLLELKTKTKTFKITEKFIESIADLYCINKIDLKEFLLALFEQESIKNRNARVNDENANGWILACCKNKYG